MRSSSAKTALSFSKVRRLTLSRFRRHPLSIKLKHKHSHTHEHTLVSRVVETYKKNYGKKNLPLVALVFIVHVNALGVYLYLFL